MGMDGISLWLVVLTTFLTPLCVLISWNLDSRTGKRILHPAADSGNCADRRVHVARSVSSFTSSGKPR
jgi:hypothetical protein